MSAEMGDERRLRPLERCVRRLVDAGADPDEIAWRLRRTRRGIRQVLMLSSRPRPAIARRPNTEVLRPLERRILAWRDAGASYAEIGARFRRSPSFVRRVEELARTKLARSGSAAG
jgi:hypothetical protein